jgi:DNA repair protein RadC
MPAPISAWPEADRPRERLLTRGAGPLSDGELIALLLGTGRRGQSALSLAHDLLKATGGIDGLGKSPAAVLTLLPGMGAAKTARILAACELGRRREGCPGRDKKSVAGPQTASALALARLRDERQECFWALFLNTKHQIIGDEILSRGGLDHAPIRAADLFRKAVEVSASALIVAHNHPSGDPTPSVQDIKVTEQLQDAGRILGIRLLDHIVVGNGTYTSLRAAGHVSEG